ncbi:RDD family protein [Marinifilum caeruleilacunae]|nr:RDD family protein [Marinifilum caeruleilacunae]
MESITKIEIKTKANLGKRISAAFIDYSIVLTFISVMFYFYAEPIENGYLLSGLPFWVIIVFWGFMTIGMEQVLGATLGNYLSDLKPVSIQSFENQKLSFGQSVKRHIPDLIDLFMFGLIGFLFIANTRYHQRLGDIWGHTIVIDTTDKEQGIQ